MAIDGVKIIDDWEHMVEMSVLLKSFVIIGMTEESERQRKRLAT